MEYGKDFNDGDLIRALGSLQQICIQKLEYHEAIQFFDFYQKTLESVQAYAYQKPSPYFQEKLLELPVIELAEVKDFVSDRRGYKKLRKAFAHMDRITFIIYKLLQFVGLMPEDKSKEFQEKLLHTADIFQNMVYVLRHPGFEDLYLESKKKGFS